MRYVDENVKNEMGLYLADYLIESGCTTLDGFEMRNNISCKVSCPNPAHGDNPPSAYYLGNWRYGNPVVHCRSCGNVWDLFRLIGVRENLPEFSQQVERAWELYGSRDRSAATRTVPKNLQAVREEVATEDKVRIQQYILNSQQNILQTDFWRKRGFTEDFVKARGLGYDVQKKRLIIPTDTAYVAIATQSDESVCYKSPKGISVSLSGSTHLKEQGGVFVVERALDALAIEQAGGRAIALNSVSNVTLLISLAKDSPSRFFITFDNDEFRQRMGNDLSDKLFVIQRVPVEFYYDAWHPYKGPTEWLSMEGHGRLSDHIEKMLLESPMPDIQRKQNGKKKKRFHVEDKLN